MSYSFIVRAASKAEVKALVASKLAEVVATQPSHQHDQAQANAAASAFVDCLGDDDTRDIAVNVNGSVGWSGGCWGEGHTVTSASVSVSAYLVAKE